MKVRGLEMTLEDGPKLSEQTLDEMLALRAQFMSIKPEIRPEEDRELFVSWMRSPGCTVAISRDAAGVIQVYLDMNSLRHEHQGRSYLICYGNFVFASAEYRSHPAYTIGNFWNLFAQLHRNKMRWSDHVIYTGTLYPTTFLMGARVFPSFWAAGEPGVPPEIAAVIDQVSPQIFGKSWMPDERLIRMRTIPQDYVPRSPEMAALLARYEARNPRWREGYGVVMINPLNVSNLLAAASVAMRRAMRF
jgi:hypothetical protein